MRRRLRQMERSDLIEYIKELEEENERLHSSLDPVHHPYHRIVSGNEEKEMITQADRHVWVDPQCIFEGLKLYDGWRRERHKEELQKKQQLELELAKIMFEGGLR
jgi:hypothetical protein